MGCVRITGLPGVLVGLVVAPCTSTAATPPAADPPSVVLIAQQLSPSEQAALEQTLRESKRYRLLPVDALLPLMRQQDQRAQLRKRAGAMIEAGRAALVALEHERARHHFTEAARLLEDGFVRIYDPRQLAQTRVLLGVAAMQAARPDLAHEAFIAALHLDPALKLDAYYSPQVRRVFQQAADSLPPRPVPPSTLLAKLAKLAQTSLLVIAKGEQADTVTRRLTVVFYRANNKRFSEPQTQLFRGSSSSQLMSFLKSVRARCLALFPPAPRTLDKLPRQPAMRVQQRDLYKPRPWYLRWYTLAAAAAVVAAAVAIPLALRQEHASLRVEWPAAASQ